jgi:Na+-exporting ATPase
MGQTVLPIVEDTAPQETEPPIGGLNGLNSSLNQRQLQPTAGDGSNPPPLYAPHTLTFTQAAEALRVNIE